MATATTTLVGERRYLLDGISWQFYQQFLAEVGDRPIRLTYDWGRLEIMSPLRPHESFKSILGRMVETITEELNVPVSSCGSTTLQREELQRGLEPDECYYVEHEPLVRGVGNLDLSRDPPPDLAIEIDITSSSVNRQGIYAALGVPELWRFDGEELWFLHLQPDGTYQPRETSRSFPFLRLADVVGFLEQLHDTDQTSVIRAFRAWFRAEILPNYPGAGNAPPPPL
jgi:Uma2 family endonuclease